MEILELKFMQEFIQVCTMGYQKGWHERNGGNLSYRLNALEVDQCRAFFNPKEWREIGTNVSALKHEYFLVTGSGKYFRNVPIYPEECLCIIEIDALGNHYRVVWGLIRGGRPTSELPSHLLNLDVVKKRTNGTYRIVYHAHTTNIIALTYVLPLDNKVFTNELWQMATECPLVFPAGIGVVPWMVPGGKEIALATSELMKTYDVAVWAHHGIFVTGPDFDTVWGLIETVEKSAELLVKVKSMGGVKRQTIRKEDFIELAHDFKVELNDEML